MRKYLAIILGVVFVLGFAASAFAIHAEIPAETQAVVTKGVQVTIGGDIRVRGEFQGNTSDFNDDAADHKTFYDERIRLYVDAQVTPNTKGFIMLEGTSGQTATGYNWGGQAGDASGSAGFYRQGDTKRATLNILEAWILNTGSGLLGMPAGIKIGHMPLALGNKFFFDHTLFGDDAIVLFADPTKELHVALLTAKFREGDTALNDDANAYVLLANYRTKEWGVSGDVTYVDDQLGLGIQNAKLPIHLWNFGLRGDVTFSGFTLRADGEFQTGKVDVADADFKGYAWNAGLDYAFSGIKLTAQYIYGSGPKSGSKNVDWFVTSVSPYQRITYVYDYRTVTACPGLPAGATNGGICNTQYVNLGVSAGLMKDLTGDLNFYWLRAAKNTSVQLAYADGSGNKPATLGNSKDIGTELDFKLSYKIDKNLNYWVEGGYLFAGGFYDTANHNADDAWAVRHGIQLTF